jgi:hypothetical protein
MEFTQTTIEIDFESNSTDRLEHTIHRPERISYYVLYDVCMYQSSPKNKRPGHDMSPLEN